MAEDLYAQHASHKGYTRGVYLRLSDRC